MLSCFIFVYDVRERILAVAEAEGREQSMRDEAFFFFFFLTMIVWNLDMTPSG